MKLPDSSCAARRDSTSLRSSWFEPHSCSRNSWRFSGECCKAASKTCCTCCHRLSATLHLYSAHSGCTYDRTNRLLDSFGRIALYGISLGVMQSKPEPGERDHSAAVMHAA